MRAGRVCELALKAILVEGADASPEPDEYADFIDALNNWMASLEAERIILGYVPVDNVNDEVTVPAGALQGIIAGMAIQVAPQYDSPIPASLTTQAEHGMKMMRRLARRTIQTSLPPTLPLGSGNDQWGTPDHQFYGNRNDGRVALRGNTVATVFAAADTPVRVAGFWETPESHGFITDINGRLTSVSDCNLSVNVQVSLTAIGDGAYYFGIGVDGSTTSVNNAVALTSTASDHTFTTPVTLKPGQYIELYAMASAHTNSATIQTADVRVL